MTYPIAPTFTGPVASNIATNELYRPFSGIQCYTNQAFSDYVVVKPNTIDNGYLTIPDNLRNNFTGVTFNPIDGSYTLGVSLANHPNLTAALDSLEFIPNSNLIASGQYLMTTFTISVSYTAYGFYLTIPQYYVDEYASEQFSGLFNALY